MKSKSFCVMPWVNLSTDVNGSLRPCCKFAQPNPDNEYQLPFMDEDRIDKLWNDNRFQQLRQAFLDGKQIKECHQCWEEESAGIVSMRQSHNKMHDLSNIEFDTPISTRPTTYDLKLSNVCNLKCRICGPMASSTLFKEHKERYGIPIVEDKNSWLYKNEYWLENKFFDTKNEDIFIEWLHHAKHIEITGGEPMSSPENIKLLKTLDELDLLKNITFLMNTNTTILNEKVLQYLKKFKYAQVFLSIDDIGSRYEYQRFPADFSHVTKSIKKYKELQDNNSNVKITIFSTISNYNIYYIDEIYDWIKSIGLPHLFNILHYSSFNCIKNLPESVKIDIVNKYKVSDIEGIHEILNFLNQPGKNEIADFLKEIKEVDAIREQNFEKTFNEWYKILTHE